MKQRAEPHYEDNSVTHLAPKKIWWLHDCPYDVNPYIRQCTNLEAFVVLYSFRKNGKKKQQTMFKRRRRGKSLGRVITT